MALLANRERELITERSFRAHSTTLCQNYVNVCHAISETSYFHQKQHMKRLVLHYGCIKWTVYRALYIVVFSFMLTNMHFTELHAIQ